MVKLRAFRSILKKSQEELEETLINCLKDKYKLLVGDGFIYGKGTIPILLVAHMDTVHKNKPENIFYDSEKKVLWSSEGVGGDDRCGVYTILKIISAKFRPHILFLEDEEIGCVGAKKCVELMKKPDVKFMIELDRKGKEDCVFYSCGNEEFIKYIESFGFKKAYGSYTDICTLSDTWDIASVNLSVGYYNAHTLQEYINLLELVSTYEKVVKILEDDKNNSVYFNYQKKVYQYLTRSSLQPIDKKSKKDKKSKANIYENDGCTYYDDFGWTDEYGRWHWYDDEEKRSL